VPDRDHEYPNPSAPYAGGTNVDSHGNVVDPQDLDCANPLFAGSLPTGLGDPAAPGYAAELCNLSAAGGAARSPKLVFYAHIGGVPHQLLQLTPGETDPVTGTTCSVTTAQADCPQKDTLAVADWTKILGAGLGATAGPEAFDYTGIDPHMIEAFNPPRTSSTGATVPVVPTTCSRSIANTRAFSRSRIRQAILLRATARGDKPIRSTHTRATAEPSDSPRMQFRRCVA
jgi:hypothetical protein